MAALASKAAAATVSPDLASPALSRRHRTSSARPTRRPAAACSLRTRGRDRLPAAVVAAAAAAAAPAKEEVLLQPIKEISGVVKLPGSKSLSNRILLLSALAEVINKALSSPPSFRLNRNVFSR
jgi:3-phosphoshikimate 1-carboxyvinyltransferase